MTGSTDCPDLYLDAGERERIEKAAALRGMTVSAFMRHVVLREVDALIAADIAASLPKPEVHRHPPALDEPFRPNDRLKRVIQAAARLKPR